ncbi:MAG: glycosyltransferase family 2 protein [bacterium]|nr:glycosyltransferase family 2 protein [bacterium]
MAKPFLSVIIPAFNEARRLPLTLIDVDQHLHDQEYSYEIIVVNDGSIDETAGIVNRFTSLIENLKLVDSADNKGKGSAVRRGMLAAKGTWRLFMDADNSTSVVEFNKMIPYFKQGYEIVIGSRDLKTSRMSPAQTLYKRFLGNTGNLVIQTLLLPKIWDTQCGFKCFSEEAALRIFGVAKINGWGFDAESLALARELEYQIKEIPVFWANSTKTYVTMMSYLHTFVEIVKIRWWLWRGSYNL